MEKNERQEISGNIADIMINDGPDGHCDGSEVIAEYVIALMEGRGKEWWTKYQERQND